MDTLRYLIPTFLKVASLFFLAAFVWWLVSLVSPSLGIKNLASLTKASTSTKQDLLPSPRQYAGLFKNKAAPDANTNVYTPGDPFNGYNLTNNQYQYTTYSYVDFTKKGTTVPAELIGGVPKTKVSAVATTSPSPVPSQPATAFANNRSLTIRNLSIYQGGHVYTGLSFTGEARESLFRDGKFPIVVIDQSGKVIGVSAAVARTNWSVPGWVRFETKINYVLPANAPCLMLFEEALTQEERMNKTPLRIPLPVRCN